MAHSEESDLQAPSTSDASAFMSTGSGSDDHLIEIFEREIDKEIAEKMGTLSEISDNIKETQQTLEKLRKEALNKFYMDSLKNLRNGGQPSIHPAVKKLIGKRPREESQTDLFLASNIAEWKRESRKKLLKKCFKKHKSKHRQKFRGDSTVNDDLIVKPRYVPPSIPGNPQENSSLRGNTKKMHMRVLVGNVAKQIQSKGDVFDPATHKWMVYVRSAPGSLSVDREVARVNFFLHPSYKPHDLVTVPSPPFTLNRRGWGEFPMRVQLHFKNRLNKPADIIHHLKLNGARSGLHTRSAETFVDLWIYPNKSAKENKGNDVKTSKEILSLASDMLKEEVPDFTCEVICNRCQTTGLGTDSHNCTCDIKDSTQDSGSSDSTEESSGSTSEEYDSSDSDDSAVETMAPKPLPCWKIPYGDLVEEQPVFFKEEMEESQFSNVSFMDKSSNFGELDERKDGQLKTEIPSVEESNVLSINTNEELFSDSVSSDCFRLAVENEFSKVGSDILNVEASDIMDALEMKQEIKEEPQESAKELNESIETRIYEKSNLTNPSEASYIMDALEMKQEVKEEPQESAKELNESIETRVYEKSNLTNPSEVSDIMDALGIKLEVKEKLQESAKEFYENIETTMYEENNLEIPRNVGKTPRDLETIPRDVVRSTMLLEDGNLSKHMEQPMEVDLEHLENEIIYNPNAVNTVKVLPNDNGSLFANHSKNWFSDSNVIIEEVPIDEFINNIVEEEIVVEIPDVRVDKKPVKKLETLMPNELPEIQVAAVLGTQSSLEVENPPSQLKMQVPCTNEVVQNKPTASITKQPTKTTPTIKNVFIPSANTFASSKELLVNKLVSAVKQPVNTSPKYLKFQPLKLVKSVKDKELSSNSQSPLPGKGEPNLSIPSIKIPSTSPKYIKITKGHVIGHPNLNHDPKTLKINELSQTPSTKGTSLLVSPGSSILKSSNLLPTQYQPKNYGSMNLAAKTSLGQNNFSKVKSQNTSLLRPQFQNNNTLKLNTRNPNSLLKPIIKNVQTNSSNLQTFQKSSEQVSPVIRPLTYSVLKSTANNASAQQKIKLQNSTVNSANANTYNPKNRTHNLVINQLIPQGHKSVFTQKISQLKSNQSCNQTTSTNNLIPDNTLGQEILRLSNSLNKKEPEPLPKTQTDSTGNVAETFNSSQENCLVRCSAPESFNRKHYLPDSKPLISRSQGKCHRLNADIVKSPLEDLEAQVTANHIATIKDTVSFDELLRIIHFPKASIPSRPVILNSGGSEKEVKAVEPDCLLSCNSLHSDLQKTYFVPPESQFGRKAVMYYKDKLNFAVHEQVLYYLEQLRLLVNTCVFRETESAVRWLVRGLPLVHVDARLVAYKMVHPYCAISTEAYCSWPSFKQAAAEWLRAKTVVRLLAGLITKGTLLEEAWSTKTVYWWCRTHGYSPAFCLIGPENSTNSNTDFIQKIQQKTSPTKVLEWMASVRSKVKRIPDGDVDVVGTDSQVLGNKGSESKNEIVESVGGGGQIYGQPWVHDMYNYVVNQVSEKVEGAQLGQESLVAEGPPQPLAANLLSHATVALAEDLLRRGLAIAARRGSGCLEPRDICRAILKRPEYDVFTGQGLKVDKTFREYLKSPRPP